MSVIPPTPPETKRYLEELASISHAAQAVRMYAECVCKSPINNLEKVMGNNLSMAMYQFSNDELNELKILLNYAAKMGETHGNVPAVTPTSICAVSNRHIATINSILASRSGRG